MGALSERGGSPAQAILKSLSQGPRLIPDYTGQDLEGRAQAVMHGWLLQLTLQGPAKCPGTPYNLAPRCQEAALPSKVCALGHSLVRGSCYIHQLVLLSCLFQKFLLWEFSNFKFSSLPRGQ